MKKRSATDIRDIISDDDNLVTSITFISSKKKERIALELIADEMDENGIGFKEALVNLLYNNIDFEPEPVKFKPKSKKRPNAKKRPKINGFNIEQKEISNDSEIDSVKTDEIKKKNTEQKDNSNTMKSTAEIIAENKRKKESSGNLSDKDKEELKRKLLNSYRA